MKASITARMAANSGRADSVFIVLLTLEILSPKGLNLALLISVKRSQNGICFTSRSFLEFYLESKDAHVPTGAKRSAAVARAASREPNETKSLAGGPFLDKRRKWRLGC